MVKKVTHKTQKRKTGAVAGTGFQRKYSDIFDKKQKALNKSANKARHKKTKCAVTPEPPAPEPEVEEPAKVPETNDSGKSKKKGKQPRFILFVGNLSYKTTKEALEKHFKKAGELERVRPLLNDKKEPKGCAFVEFKTSAGMLNALLYHHTTFEERKINVEMTCGGGGNSANRKKKIQEKRSKSNELIHKMLKQKKATKNAPIK